MHPSCGILAGRSDTNSGSRLVLERVKVFGQFTRANVYTVACEDSTSRSCSFGSTASTGNYANYYSAQTTNSIFGLVPSKYTVYSGDGTGGNSMNAFYGCEFLYRTNGVTQEGANFVTEYAQGLLFDSCYFFTQTSSNQFIVNMGSAGGAELSFRNSRFEMAAQSYFRFRGNGKTKAITFENCQVPPIYGDDNHSIHGLRVIDSD